MPPCSWFCAAQQEATGLLVCGLLLPASTMYLSHLPSDALINEETNRHRGAKSIGPKGLQTTFILKARSHLPWLV